MAQNITHHNHYVPKFYLKNWSLDGTTIQTYSILVSDSHVPYWTRQPIKKTAAWNDFYTRVQGEKEIDDFEHWFDREFERPAEPVFHKLLNGEKITHKESIVLSHFVFAQYVRTPAYYLRHMESSKKVLPIVMDEVLSEVSRISGQMEHGYPPPNIPPAENENLFPMRASVNREDSTVEIKVLAGKGLYLHSLRHLLTSTLKVAEYLDWHVIHAADDVLFPTSDDPVICLNYQNEHTYDFNGGWGKKNCNILMPLSPHLLLFTQIGKKGPYDFLDYSPSYSRLFRQMIIQHAHRYVYADKPQRGMLALNARIVNRDLYEKEKQTMAGWHTEQMQAERDF